MTTRLIEFEPHYKWGFTNPSQTCEHEKPFTSRLVSQKLNGAVIARFIVGPGSSRASSESSAIDYCYTSGIRFYNFQSVSVTYDTFDVSNLMITADEVSSRILAVQ